MPTIAQQHRVGNGPHIPISRFARDTDAPLESFSMWQRLQGLFANPWKNYLLPTGFLTWVMSRSASPLIAEARIRPGGWRSMEILYRNEEPVDWVDRQVLRENPVSMAARNRRRIVTARLAALISVYAIRGPVTILGIGAGPGRHVQEAIIASGISTDTVNAWLIDRDDDAFAFGRELAERLGLAHAVHFLKGDACHIQQVLPDLSPQIVKLVGIVEYLSDSQLVELLRVVRDIMPAGGSLLTHGMADPYGGSRFLKRVWNLKHRKRSAKYMTAILESVGFKVVESMTEPTGIYPILTAIRPD